jgi:hypothetical protein
MRDTVDKGGTMVDRKKERWRKREKVRWRRKERDRGREG